MITLVAKSFVNTGDSITLPSGIQADDVLVIYSSSDTGIATPTDWTELVSVLYASNAMEAAVYYKVANGTESSTSVNVGGSDMNSEPTHMAFVLRGADASSFQSATGTGTSTTISTSAGVSPVVGEAFFFIFSSNAGSKTWTSQQIANNNPTWTEQYDFSSAILNPSSAAATASWDSTEVGATGVASATASSGTEEKAIILVSVTDDTERIVTHSALEMSSTIQVHKGKVDVDRFTPQERGTKTWTNETI